MLRLKLVVFSLASLAVSSPILDLLAQEDKTDKPIIGIISGGIADLTSSEQDHTPYLNYTSYISRNYVQILHAHGARVIALPYNAPFEKL
jgi:hypothetical protein